MSEEDRIHFWIWTFTAIASVESDCGVNALNPRDTNGQSVCDFQLPNQEILDVKKGSRDPSWRGPGCDIYNDGREPAAEWIKYKKSNSKFEMSNDATCAACAVEILGKNLCGFHSVRGKGVKCTDPPLEKLFGRHMFWNEAKAHREKGAKKIPRKITQLIQKYPGCKR